MLKRGRALRVGPRLELAGGLVRGDGGPRVAGVGARDEGGELTPRFRLGGLELLTGLELVAWFDVPRRRRAGAASPEKKP
ncbi:MAG: hypothetical protein H6713_20305 [Myxococcales bacterium]|nr:hypothetical protein [Myxococcales bacterium]